MQDDTICEIRVGIGDKIYLHLPRLEPFGDEDSVYLAEEDEKNLLSILREYLNIEFDPDAGYDVSLKETGKKQKE